MALSAFLTLKGQKQGDIRGSVTEKGKEGSILVHGFENGISNVLDQGSGLPVGKRQHEPLVIVKEIDQSSPKLWSALVTNENLTQWVLNVWTSSVRPGPGTERNIYRIELTNANVALIEESMVDDSIQANQSLPLHEEVTFTYQKITWTWLEGGITATDEWATAAV